MANETFSPTPEIIQRVESFHGHMCPGLAIGIRVAEFALWDMGPRSRDEELVAVVETDMCGIDAIQFLTGCTFGKGNLIHLDYGKNAFTFFNRSDGRGIRLVFRHERFASLSEEMNELIKKRQSGTLTDVEKERLEEIMRKRIDGILTAPLEDLFERKDPLTPPPRPARIHRSLMCESCHEWVMETRIRHFNDRHLCIPCFDSHERR